MFETASRVCDHCGAPLRGLVDGYCPYCRTRPFTAAGAAAPAPVVGLHTVLLLDAGPNKISVIKELREVVQREFTVELGLKEAKDLVERANRTSPPALIVDVEPARAEAWVAAFAAAGAVVEITPPIGSAPAAPPAAGTTYAVYLTVVGRKKINVIKAVREITGLGLKEAKDLVDGADHAPQLVAANLDQQTATTDAQLLANAGASAEVRAV